jgi:hypothetical protein
MHHTDCLELMRLILTNSKILATLMKSADLANNALTSCGTELKMVTLMEMDLHATVGTKMSAHPMSNSDQSMKTTLAVLSSPHTLNSSALDLDPQEPLPTLLQLPSLSPSLPWSLL